MPLHSLAACEPTRASRRIDYPGREYQRGPPFPLTVIAQCSFSQSRWQSAIRMLRWTSAPAARAAQNSMSSKRLRSRCQPAPYGLAMNSFSYGVSLPQITIVPGDERWWAATKAIPKSQSNKGTHDRWRHRFADRWNLAPPTCEQCDGNAFACERYCRGRSRRATPQHDHVIAGLDRSHRCAAVQIRARRAMRFARTAGRDQPRQTPAGRRLVAER